MANFERDMTADRWTRDEVIANLKTAVEACEARQDHFHSNQPNAQAFTAWQRHGLAVAAAVKLLEARQ